ncbi:serine-tRNA ligase [Mytilinidion resinicola]|uniref:serine--tRNA ligase n=1 Tax=Mytilinidion resinicola TaxID=574789 RepID=A0A6A6Y1D6_9PEZI|nr:serine-tRNA ligase [Mytilinidion resinicola]KAF2802626.1 serine-tRNA ligase [Mytilinidion resinicola]
MLDINDFIKERGGDAAKIRQSQEKRHASVELVDEIIEDFEVHRKTQYASTQIGAAINPLQKQIGLKKKAKEDATELLAEIAKLKEDKKAKEEEAAELLEKLLRKVKTVGNYVHESVPISGNEDDNETIKQWAPEGVKVEHNPDVLPHHGVLTRLDGYDPERGVKIVGHRGYCLTGYGLFLNLALVNYGLEFLFNRGYTPNQPPFFMLRDVMAKTAQLSDFDEELYKVTESKDKPDTDKYLIATSEQPISALHSDEWLQEKDLPIKYAGYSTNFRKEAGSHGKDAWGIFRIHQFEKIEQFLFTKPEESWKAYEEMLETSEAFYQSLKLPYRVVKIVSGALNNAASAKRDLEAWFPYTGEYKELVSISNCTDYQTRELEIRFGPKKQTGGRKEYVHALNGTLCATERTLCCIMENYQTPEGMVVPEVLRKYIPGQPEFLPFVKEFRPEKVPVVVPDRTK